MQLYLVLYIDNLTKEDDMVLPVVYKRMMEDLTTYSPTPHVAVKKQELVDIELQNE